MSDHPSLLEFSWADARGAGHFVPELDTPDLSKLAPSWALEGHAARWWAFHVQHPEVGRELERLARQLLRKGHAHFGIAMLWETLRCHSMLGSAPDEPGPRLNNNHRAYYARWLMEENQDLLGVFELRSTEGNKP